MRTVSECIEISDPPTNPPPMQCSDNVKRQIRHIYFLTAICYYKEMIMSSNCTETREKKRTFILTYCLDYIEQENFFST